MKINGVSLIAAAMPIPMPFHRDESGSARSPMISASSTRSTTISPAFQTAQLNTVPASNTRAAKGV
jgi:hypothetical protein